MPSPRHLHPTVPAYCASRRLAEDYDEFYADTALFRYDLRFILQHLDNAFGSRPIRRLAGLDLGCGTGRHLLALVGRGWDVAGVDLNPHMIEAARRKLAAAGVDVSVASAAPGSPGAGETPKPAPGAAAANDPSTQHPPRARLEQADFHDLSWPAEWRFDAILMMFSTIGLVRPAARRLALLRLLRRRLRPGGRFFLHVHNARYNREPRRRPVLERLARAAGNVVAGLRGGAGGDAPAPENATAGPDALAPYEPGDQIMRGYRGELDLFLHVFTMEELESLVRAAGYRVIELRPLAAARDGPYLGRDPAAEANGFLLAAAADDGGEPRAPA